MPGRLHWIGYRWKTTPAGVLPRIIAVRHGQRPPWGRTKRIIHPFWVLDYAGSDCGRVRIGSPRAPWRPRDAKTLHVYPPGTPYWEDTTPLHAPLRESYAILAGGELAGLDRFIDWRTRFGRIMDPSGTLDGPLHAMASTGLARGEDGFWSAQAALADLLDRLNTSAVPGENGWVLRPTTARPSAPGFVAATQDYFREHLSKRLTIAAVAEQFHMSASAFAHRYAAEAGEPPMAALTRLRLDLGRDLLLRGMKMHAIARQTGFCDAFHFSKAFRRHHGLPPSRFRDDSWRQLRPSAQV